MTYRNTQLANELFDYLSRFFPLLAIVPGDVKDRFSFNFSIKGVLFTAIVSKDYMEEVRNSKREIEFKVDFLGKISEFRPPIKEKKEKDVKRED